MILLVCICVICVHSWVQYIDIEVQFALRFSLTSCNFSTSRAFEDVQDLQRWPSPSCSQGGIETSGLIRSLFGAVSLLPLNLLQDVSICDVEKDLVKVIPGSDTVPMLLRNEHFKDR